MIKSVRIYGIDSTIQPRVNLLSTESINEHAEMTTTAHQDASPVPINTVRVTPKAAAKAREFAAKEGRDHCALKIAVQGGGCSGLQYILELVEQPDETDKVISDNGIEVYIPKRAFVFLAGTVLDFSDGLNGRGFEFHNPNAKRTCGCGDSFAV